MWGLGVLGLSRYEFYTSTIPELANRIKGFLIRKLELENVGNRRVGNIIFNGLNAFGGGKAISENKFWPMGIDRHHIKEVKKSEDIVSEEKDFILHFWPDVKIDG